MPRNTRNSRRAMREERELEEQDAELSARLQELLTVRPSTKTPVVNSGASVSTAQASDVMVISKKDLQELLSVELAKILATQSANQNPGAFENPITSNKDEDVVVENPSHRAVDDSIRNLRQERGNAKQFHANSSSVKIPVYAGAHETRTPYDFIAELERYQIVSACNEYEMLTVVIPQALKDEAWQWYQFSQCSIHNWADFKRLFRKEFQQIGYDRELRKMLDERTQGIEEPLTSFIRTINNIYDRLETYTSEKDRIGMMIRNMHPEYRQKLQSSGRNFNSIIDLLDEAHNAQESIKLDRDYKQPSTYNSVEPSLCYKPSSGKLLAQTSVVENSKKGSPEDSNWREKGNELQMSSIDPFKHFHSGNSSQSLAPKRSSSHQPNSNISRPQSSNTQFQSNSSFRPGNNSQGQFNNSQGQFNNNRSRFPPPFDNTRRIVCFNCRQEGHYKNECPGLSQFSGNGPSPSRN